MKFNSNIQKDFCSCVHVVIDLPSTSSIQIFPDKGLYNWVFTQNTKIQRSAVPKWDFTKQLPAITDSKVGMYCSSNLCQTPVFETTSLVFCCSKIQTSRQLKQSVTCNYRQHGWLVLQLQIAASSACAPTSSLATLNSHILELCFHAFWFCF